MTLAADSSSTCITFLHAVSPCSAKLLILSTESDLGGMGGRSAGWYFLGRGGRLAIDILDPLSTIFSTTAGFLSGLCVLRMVENV